MKKIVLTVFTVILTLFTLASCSLANEEKNFSEMFDDLTVKCADITESLYVADTEKAVSEYGIEKDLIKNAVFLRAPDKNIRADELIIIEAVSKTAAEDLKTAFAMIQQEKYMKWESLDNTEFEKVKNYKTVTLGRYMIYAVCDGADKIIAEFEEIFK